MKPLDKQILVDTNHEDDAAVRLSAAVPKDIFAGFRRRSVRGTPPAAAEETDDDWSTTSSSYGGAEEWKTARSLPQRPVVHKRVRSWSCEGAALYKKYEDYDSDCETDLDDDDDKVFLIPAMPPRNPTRKLTPAAIALAHGNKFVKKPISKSNSGRQQQLTSNMKRPATKWLIPVNHPLKIIWDVLTVVLSIYNAYATHAAIRDRQFHRSGWMDAWFMMDIALNFLTQRSSTGMVYNTWQAVWARYLTSWFVIDVLALFPAELLYIQPVIEMQRRRKFLSKLIRRTKVATKVTTRILQSGHVPWVIKVIVKTTSRPVRELISLIRVCIKYIPNYFQFVRRCKGVILVRLLRDFGHFRAAWRHQNNNHDSIGGETVDLTMDEDEDDNERQEAWEGLNEYDHDEDSDPF